MKKAKRKIVRRVKKRSVRACKAEAWKAVSLRIRSLQKNCVTCGALGTQAGHFIHTSDKKGKSLDGNALWYDERNLAPQCTACNRWKHGNLVAYALWLENRYGHGIIQTLWKLYKTPKKWTREELAIIAGL